MYRKLSVLGVVFIVCGIAVAPVVLAGRHGMNRNFVAHLSGLEAGAETLGQGQAVFHLSKDGSELSYKLTVANIENVNMAHIHLAPPGQDGPPVLWLYPDAPPPQLIEGRVDGVLATGTATDSDLVGPLAGMTIADLVEKIRNGETYVNVHTLQYPGGEIRGEVH